MDEWWDENGWHESDPGRGEGTRPRFDWMGTDREKRGLGNGDAGGVRPPRLPRYGMTTGQLYRYQRLFTGYAASRLIGVGKDQYDQGESQKFEDMTVGDLITGLREELADVVNYAVMLDIRLGRLLGGGGDG